MDKLKIIAISGASGSGKSALIKELAPILGCGLLRFDDYIDAGTYPQDMCSWLAQGADVNLIKTPRFTRALQQAIADAAAADVAGYLLLEEPFGRQRLEMASLIDSVVLLSPPPELCLSRVIQRNLSTRKQMTELPTQGMDAIQAVTQIRCYLRCYDEYLRDAYQTTVAQVAQNCDLQINHIAPVSDMATTVRRWLAQQQQTQSTVNSSN